MAVCGIEFVTLRGPIKVCVPRSKYFSNMSESFRAGIASLNLMDEFIKAHRLRILVLPESFILLQ